MEEAWWSGTGALLLAVVYAISPGMAVLLLIVMLTRRFTNNQHRRAQAAQARRQRETLAKDYVRLLEKLEGY